MKLSQTDVDRMVKEFFAKGGRIIQCERGARSIPLTNEVVGSAWGKPKKKSRG